MASKASYDATAVLGIAAASGAAWWYQSKPQAPVEMAGASGGLAASAPNAAASSPTSAASAPVARPAGVEVAKVEKMQLQDDAQSVGSLRSRQSVMLRPEVAGRIKQLGFTDGQRVRKGQVLVQLDDVLQRAEIKQAQAQVSIALANLKRNQELVAQNFVAQRVLEESAANLQVVEAQLALSCARLSRMAILAPFDATVGIRVVNIGDFVKDGADLINLEDTSSMFVDFRLPERFQGKVRLQQPVELTLDAFPGRAFKARIEAIDPLLDVNGRSVGVRALLPNTMGEPVRETGRGGSGGAGGPGGRAGSAPPQGSSGGAGGASPGVAGASRTGGVSVATAGRPGANPQTGSGPAMAAGAGGQGARMGARAGGPPAGPAAAGARTGAPGGGGGAQANANPMDANGCPVDAAIGPSTESSVSAPAVGGAASRSGRPGAGAGSNVTGASGGAAQGAGQGGRGGIPGGQAAAGGSPAPLRPGMFARVNTVFSINEAALVIPEEAVVPQGGRQFVIKAVPPEEVAALDKSKLPEGVKFFSLRQEVRLGVRRAGRVEVVSGLDEGQSIVVAGHQRLQRDGTPLRIVELAGARGAQAGASAPGAASSMAGPVINSAAATLGASMPASAASR